MELEQHPSQYHCLNHSGMVESMRAVCAKMDEREKLVNAKLEHIDKSIEFARHEMDRRLEGMNNIHEQMEGLTRTFFPRTEYDVRHTELEARYTQNAKAIEELKMDVARRLGAKQWTDYIMTIGVSSLVYVVIHLVFKG